MSPNVQLYSELWGHVDHSNAHCICLSSDRTAAYVHELALMPRGLVHVFGRGGCFSSYRGDRCAVVSYSLPVSGTAGIGAFCL